MLKRRYSFFSGPSGPNTTQEATVPSPPVWLMSKHSMRCGRLGQVELARQVGEHLVHALALREAHAQRLRGIVARELDPAQRQAAHRVAYLDGVAGALAERLRRALPHPPGGCRAAPPAAPRRPRSTA